MPESIEKQILTKAKKAGRGSLFFVDDFIRFGNGKAVNKVLERLVEKEEMVRVAKGIYTRPEKDPVIGIIQPSIEDVAKAIARRDKARIIPTGQYALNRLGLTTQVPMNVVYLTDGSARKIRVGKRTITFKKSAPKNLTAWGEISGLAIQALRSIGKEKATEEEIRKIQDLLLNEKTSNLEHDIKLAPEWIRKIMKCSLSKKL